MTRPDIKTAALAATAGLLLCLMSPNAQAQSDATRSSWEQLSPEQRDELISPLRERWNSQPQDRARILRNAQRWKQLDPEQRRKAMHGMQRWQQMTPEQRKRARAQFEQMSPEQRKAWKDSRRTRPQR